MDELGRLPMVVGPVAPTLEVFVVFAAAAVVVAVKR